jgi:hydrogenase/urease accessory protein HupE
MPYSLLALAAVAALASPAHAHQSSLSHSSATIAADGRVHYTLRVSSRDLYEALGLDRDRDASDDEIRAGEARLFDYILGRVEVTGDGRPCPAGDRRLAIVTQNDRFAELRFTAACPLPLSTVGIAYRLFFDLDARHTGLLVVSHGEKRLTHEFTRGLGHFEWKLDLAAPSGLGPLAFVVKGVEHIFTGYDHVAFLLALLLVSVIRGRERRPTREAIVYVVKIVTAFTIAHSLTLILAGLEVVTLPSRFVESAIAASIVYVAVENLTVVEPRHRWPLAFAFGLVHGLGFASMLRPLLPPSEIVLPLLLFNVGVELGQLAIVVAVVPLLGLIARDPTRYRRLVVTLGSAAIAAFGLLWLAERVLDIELLGGFLG